MKRKTFAIDEQLWKEVAVRAIKEDVYMRDWIANSLRVVLEFDKYAKDYCLGIGWKPPAPTIDDSTPTGPA